MLVFFVLLGWCVPVLSRELWGEVYGYVGEGFRGSRRPFIFACLPADGLADYLSGGFCVGIFGPFSLLICLFILEGAVGSLTFYARGR